MCTKINFWSPLILFLIYSNTYAQQTEVIAVQEHAWVARNNVVIALKLKDFLQVGDQVRTGKNARVWLKLPDDTVVKLGEHAMFNIQDLKPVSSTNNVMKGSFELLRGAFRLTTPPKATTKHDFQIKVNSITAGVRGTDIWGTSQTEKDLICLLEGQIDVQAGETKVVLKNPKDYFIVPKNGEPVVGVLEDEATLKEWAENVELK